DRLIGASPVVLHAQLAHRVGAERGDRVAAEAEAAARRAVVHGDGRGEADDVDEREAAQKLASGAGERQVLAECQAGALKLGVDAKVIALEAGLNDRAVLLDIAA